MKTNGSSQQLQTHSSFATTSDACALIMFTCSLPLRGGCPLQHSGPQWYRQMSSRSLFSRSLYSLKHLSHGRYNSSNCSCSRSSCVFGHCRSRLNRAINRGSLDTTTQYRRHSRVIDRHATSKNARYSRSFASATLSSAEA